MFKKTRKFVLAGLGALVLMTGQIHAMSISPEMIQQFKQLPKAEQDRLAKQYGIDPSMITGGSSSGDDSKQQLDNPNLVNPRGMQNQLPAGSSNSSGGLHNQFGSFNNELINQHINFREEADSKKLKRFGLNLFAGEPTTFAPVSDVPIPSEYVVGPGDHIKIQLYGKENKQYDLMVGRSGTIQFPELGPISVAGLTFDEVRTSLAKQIQHQMIGVQSNITLGELRTIRIFIAGDAYKPGSYSVSSLSTITQALFVAGGINDIGSLRNIQLKRNGKLVGSFDLYNLLMHGDASGDLRLQSGDVVFIPSVKSLVTVEGEVRRPAIYELIDKDTISDVIQMAAGLKSGAYPKNSSIERYNLNGLKSIVGIDLTSNSGKKFKAKSGDVIRVKSASDQFENAITVVGAVVRPGKYQWYKGKRVSDVLPSLWGDLAISADLDYGLVIREINKLGDIETLQFAPGKAISQKGTDQDLVLKPRDKIIIFNFNDETQNRYDLNKLVKEHLKKVTDLTGDSLLGMDLFKAGFAQLQQREMTERYEIGGVVISSDETLKVSTEQKELVSGEVNKMLANLFEDTALIKVSGEMNRGELLYPVIIQLNTQGRAGNGVKIVGINGEVRFPGVYPLTKNIKVLDLIHAAGGLKEGAFTQNAELTRTITNNSGASIEHKKVELSKALQGDQAADVKLKSRDTLTVMTTPDWQDYKSVEIHGEVKFPGVYNIRRGETLHDVIIRSGGFTTYAYLPAAVFVRKSVQEQETLEVKKLADQLRRDIATRGVSKDGGVTNYNDAKLMLSDLEAIKPVGRLVVDLPEINDGLKSADLVLEDQDVLYVPSTKQTIAVMGEVQHAATHRFKSGLTVDDYLDMSGGSRRRADDNHTYVVKANGSVMMPNRSFWFNNNDQLMPGDTIIVPLDTEYKDNLTLWSQVTQIIYNSAVAFATIANL